MSEATPEPARAPTDQDEIEDWKLLRDMLEERDREWWAEAQEED